MVEAEDMADLVHQNREQVDACCTAGISELGIVGGGGVDEPALAIGGGVEGDRETLCPAEPAGRKIGDADLEKIEPRSRICAESGSSPDAQGFLQDRGKRLLGQRTRNWRCARLRVVKRPGIQPIFNADKALLIPQGRIGKA